MREKKYLHILDKNVFLKEGINLFGYMITVA